MKDVSAKIETHREAKASAFIAMPAPAQKMLRERTLEKGDALEIARMAGIMAAKRTSDLIPFCHGIFVTRAEVKYEFADDGVAAICTVRAQAATGVEMEALTGASLAALTLYDMLKPHTTELEIRAVRLLEKTGGKTDFASPLTPPARVAVIQLHPGDNQEHATRVVHDALQKDPSAWVADVYYITRGAPELASRIQELVASHTEIILTIGGTGVHANDFAVDTVRALTTRDLPGISEAARAYGQKRTPRAMLSRGVAGLVGQTLVVTIPGSVRGATETYAALFPAVFEVVRSVRAER